MKLSKQLLGENRFLRNGVGRSLSSYYTDWRYLLLIPPRAGEVDEGRGHNGEHVGAPEGVVTLSSSVQGVRNLIRVQGKVICDAQVKEPRVPLAEFGDFCHVARVWVGH